MVSVQALLKRFGRFVAVNGVSFDARRSEVFGLLGENGAGKTTLMRMLATVLQPTDGDALVCGASLIRDPSAVRRHVGFLTADSGLYDRLSAWENVQYFGELYGVDRRTIRVRTQEIFELLDLTEVAGKPVGQFSKGMRQKVCLARTFVHDPAVLLLDEPSSGLDVSSTHTVCDFILSQRQAGKVIIFSSHIMSEVEKLCDRVAVIHHGEIIAQGTIDDLRQTHRTTRLEEVFLRLVGELS